MNARWLRTVLAIGACGLTLGECSSIGTPIADVSARARWILGALPVAVSEPRSERSPRKLALEALPCRMLTEAECEVDTECEPLRALAWERRTEPRSDGFEVYLGCHPSAYE